MWMLELQGRKTEGGQAEGFTTSCPQSSHTEREQQGPSSPCAVSSRHGDLTWQLMRCDQWSMRLLSPPPRVRLGNEEKDVYAIRSQGF